MEDGEKKPLHIRAQQHMDEYPEVWMSFGITIAVLGYMSFRSFRNLRRTEERLRIAHQNYLVRLARHEQSVGTSPIPSVGDAVDDLKRFPDVQLPDQKTKQ
eukprot:TRINITY_DN2994_c0_g2_i1.p2 TRINITY_DN2994_c0_g2~~TRINITY_DN2994_c0_g2_i1.p2  ORF type:complete len:101 (+),score=24.36 TRINITY_DN2994_c0_g2_i1:61-363(+)